MVEKWKQANRTYTAKLEMEWECKDEVKYVVNGSYAQVQEMMAGWLLALVKFNDKLSYFDLLITTDNQLAYYLLIEQGDSSRSRDEKATLGLWPTPTEIISEVHENDEQEMVHSEVA